MPTAKYKIEFSKVLQSLCSAKLKNNLMYLYIHLVETFNSSFKNFFQEAFFVKNHQYYKTRYMHLTL